MSASETQHIVRQDIPADVPAVREYEATEDAALDRALCEAIEAAEEANGNEFLARLLALEIGSHFYQNGR